MSCAMIGEFEITLAVAGDVRQISELSRDAIESGLRWSWTPPRVARSIGESASNVIVVRQDDNLVGFAIMEYGEEEAHVVLLAVHPAHRRKGVGSALLSWLEATTRVAGMNLIRLEARTQNSEAIAFYRRHGFEELGLRRGYYQGRCGAHGQGPLAAALKSS
jgi:ribosomal-protein-alanine N-acetyltransferase